jgi:probable rRNA maturation factor
MRASATAKRQTEETMEPGSTSPFGGGLVITERRWRAHVRDIPRLVARAMQVAECDADVVLTDDRTIKQFNARDRGKNKPTNVLTYEQPAEILLGLGVVLREAQAAGKSVAAHLTHLLVHGALHLQGYDHHQAGEARRMEAEEAKLLARLGVANPWKNR